MNANDCINVAYITDTSFAMPTCISVTSLITNMGESDSIRIFIICDEVSQLQKKRFLALSTDRVCIELIDMHEEQYLRMYESCINVKTAHVTAVALYKMGLAEILEDVKKVIYLDGDTLIQKSLREMYDFDLKDDYVAAVEDMLDENKDEEGYSRLARRIGLYKREYFNSGVMLLNLEKIRQDSISQELMTYREKGPNYFMDQDALNKILSKKRAMLPYRFNFLVTAMDVYDADEIGEKFFGGEKKRIEEYVEEVVILHLTGPRKPWKYCNPWFSEKFLQYYAKSPYAQEKIGLVSPVKELMDTVKEQEGCIHRLEDRVRILENRVAYVMETRDFVVPYERIPRNCRLVLYGAGNVGKCYYKQLIATGYCEVVLWADERGQAAASEAALPSEIAGVEFDYVLVALRSKTAALEVKRLLVQEYAVDQQRITNIFDGVTCESSR